MSNSELDSIALLERLNAQEAEGAKLKEASVQITSHLIVVETESNGHPMLEFRRGNATGPSVWGSRSSKRSRRVGSR